MTVRTIQQSIEIAAPRERVWDVLLQDQTYREWTAEFMAGSYAETDWRTGSKAVFRDPTGNGMIGRIAVSERPERLVIDYNGLLVAGREDYDSPEAVEIKGAQESYHLSEQGGRTLLAIESGMFEAYYEEMSEAWVRALNKVKALAEAG